MAGKRKWPDHIGVGKTVTYDGAQVLIVDVKAGPMTFDPSQLNQRDVTIKGTLCLRVKYPGGHETWTPPLDGESFVQWCERKNAEALEKSP